MITPTDGGLRFHISGNTADAIQADIDIAVDLVKVQAIRSGQHGILVTRHGPGNYTVAICPEVPYGQTLEKHAASSST